MADRILDWPGDTTASGDSVPLRLAGALHALKIEELALDGVYPPNQVDDETLWTAIEAALRLHENRVLNWLDNPPQTNEVRRAAVLLPALALVAQEYDAPVELLELGASAGLNLRCDAFRLDLPSGGLGPEGSPVHLAPKWSGAAPLGPLPKIISRKGVDLNPLDPSAPADRLRLLAYLWSDQAERIARTEAAIQIAQDIEAEITAGDAADWTENILSEPAPDRVRVLFHTVAWQYFPEDTKARCLAAMQRVTTPLVRISMEADGGNGAAVTITEWPGGKTRQLGRVSFHGLWVDWTG